MRTLAALAVLLLVSCGGEPAPEDVAGIYDLYAINGVRWEWWGWPEVEASLEFKTDSTMVSRTVPPGLHSPFTNSGEYSVTVVTGGCLGVSVRWENADMEPFLARVCGDTLTTRKPPETDENVYHKRR